MELPPVRHDPIGKAANSRTCGAMCGSDMERSNAAYSASPA
ncbi:hypothetical protein ACIBO5_18080 [Nonomuraea angiospora]